MEPPAKEEERAGHAHGSQFGAVAPQEPQQNHTARRCAIVGSAKEDHGLDAVTAEFAGLVANLARAAHRPTSPRRPSDHRRSWATSKRGDSSPSAVSSS